jgi:hypothetical protein
MENRCWALGVNLETFRYANEISKFVALKVSNFLWWSLGGSNS